MVLREGLRAVLNVAVVRAIHRHIDALRLVIVAIATVDAIKGLLRRRMLAIKLLSKRVQRVSRKVHATCLVWENQSVQVVDKLRVPVAKPEQEELFELRLV